MTSLPATRSAISRVLNQPLRENEHARVTHNSRAGVLWTIVIALDLFWMSNPLVFATFDVSLRNACAVTLLAVVLTPRRHSLALPWAVVAVLAYGLLSAFWSTWSTLTVQFDLIYVAIAVVGIAIAATVDIRTIAQGMLLGGVIYVAASGYAFWADLYGAATPASLNEPPFVAGVGTNRNVMAYTLVVCLAFVVGVVPRTWQGRGLWATGMGIIGLGLYIAQSATGMVAAILLCGVAAALGWHDRSALRNGRRSRRLSWWVALPPIAILTLAAFVLRTVLDESGRDASTMSGRTPLWSATWNSLDGWDLWFGAGWGTVWQHPWLAAGANEIHDEIVQRNAGVYQPHGHNTFFDLLPEVGLVGFLVFAMVTLETIRRGMGPRRSSMLPSEKGLEASRVVLLGVLALLIYGVTEPMGTIPLGWFVLVMLAAVPASPAPRTGELAEARDRGAAALTDPQPSIGGSGQLNSPS